MARGAAGGADSTQPPADRSSIATEGLRYDDAYERFIGGDVVLAYVVAHARGERPFSLVLRRVGARVVWDVATAVRAAYTAGGAYDSGVKTYRFDASSGRLLTVTRTPPSAASAPLPNRTPVPYDGPTTPCPRGDFSRIVFPPGTTFTTPPPNAIPGQNYRCPRPSPAPRPSPDATHPIGSFPALEEFYATARVHATVAGAYVIAVRIEPFGAAQRATAPDVIGYDTQALRLAVTTTVVYPQGLDSRGCRYDYAVATSVSYANGPPGGGGSIRGHCAAGGGRRPVGTEPQLTPVPLPSLSALRLHDVYRGEVNDDNLIVANDAALWFPSQTGLVRVANGARREVPLTPDDHARFRPAFADPVDGVVLTSWNAGQLLRVRSDGTVQRTTIPVAAASFAAAGGTIWFADFDHGLIGSIARDGRVAQHRVPTPFSGPAYVSVSMGNVWFAELAANKIGLFDGRRFTEYAAPAGRIVAVAPGNAGDAWFAYRASGRSGEPVEITLAHATSGAAPAPVTVHCSRVPAAMGVARDGTVWLGEDSAPVLTAYRPAAAVASEYVIADSEPSGWVRQIVRGADGTLYVFQNDHHVRTLTAQ